MSGGVEIDVESLYNRYRTAIRNNDIEEILRVGELYFSSLHDGEMTHEERDQIQMDVLMCAVNKTSQ
ncbi:hypothetical protein F0919_05025 [Taibaiella lutea]|uniref:Uncharacterized protein n=1 Tax=Taibaiella lutea TaxID=2608001 RepID=A0A5M6CP72_9BACT|nr:hypothetical protein [Taibaiella lutea]KAA5537038.1 hypothetical protein F0919_05025 [Taibaiella lutea]